MVPQRPVDALIAHLHEVVGQDIDEPLLLRALTHRSYAYENGGLPNNERLEFLGDSVLGVVVTETLYREHPDLAEGQLAKLRAAVVNMRALAEVARTFQLGEYVMLGKGEEATGGRDKASILADTLEALIGTVFLSTDINDAARFVHHHFDPLIEEAATLGAGLDWKTSLQEMAAGSALGSPEYRVGEQGPDHEKEFHARVVVGEEVLGEGRGRSKKEAEQKAAKQAWHTLDGRRTAPESTAPATAQVAGPTGS
ncbi:ribonuclease III [Terrabacter sp. 2RAF25]|uniref:ribonuclease III n=1 Tax=Terrabacter sp. 2RAF25 TaxID=3232998 RepID=UPI003F9BE7F9